MASSASEALHNALYKFKTYLLTYIHNVYCVNKTSQFLQ